MKNDFGHTIHPTDQLLDPKKTDKIASFIHMKFPGFLGIYILVSIQEFSSKFEMNQKLMVQSYIPVFRILF